MAGSRSAQRFHWLPRAEQPRGSSARTQADNTPGKNVQERRLEPQVLVNPLLTGPFPRDRPSRSRLRFIICSQFAKNGRVSTPFLLSQKRQRETPDSSPIWPNSAPCPSLARPHRVLIASQVDIGMRRRVPNFIQMRDRSST